MVAQASITKGAAHAEVCCIWQGSEQLNFQWLDSKARKARDAAGGAATEAGNGQAR